MPGKHRDLIICLHLRYICFTGTSSIRLSVDRLSQSPSIVTLSTTSAATTSKSAPVVGVPSDAALPTTSATYHRRGPATRLPWNSCLTLGPSCTFSRFWTEMNSHFVACISLCKRDKQSQENANSFKKLLKTERSSRKNCTALKQIQSENRQQLHVIPLIGDLQIFQRPSPEKHTAA